MEVKKIIEEYELYAKERGCSLNSDRETVNRILEGFSVNQKKHGERYCPCRRVTGNREKDRNIICPCVFMEEEVKKDGKCLCGLFVQD